MLNVFLEEELTWNIPLLTVLICIAFFYIFSIKRISVIKKTSIQPILFLLGLGLLLLTVGSPLAAISQLSFSLHMMQMSMLYFIIPPLLLLGIPEYLLTNVVKKLKIRKFYTFIPVPKVMLYAFALLFLLYHLPFILQILSQDSFLQHMYLSVLFILSFGMWWPITTPVPKQRLCKKGKKRYALLSSWIIMPACVLFMISAFLDDGSNPFMAQLTAHLCIPSESTFTLLPPPFNTKYDQFMAGIFMMGLHKVGIMMTLKLEAKVYNQPLEKPRFRKHPLLLNK